MNSFIGSDGGAADKVTDKNLNEKPITMTDKQYTRVAGNEK